MPDQPQIASVPAAEKPRIPVRWVVMAFSILLVLALIVIGTSLWILHLF
jgi:hypothetical protein